jgi:hypothetical protein
MKSKTKVFNVGKYVVAALLVSYVVVLILSDSGSSKSFEEMSAPLIRVLEDTDMVEVNGQGFREFYGINPVDVEGVVMFTGESSLSAQEVLLIQASHLDQVPELVEVIEESLVNRRQSFGYIAPQEVHMIDNAQLTVRGNHVFLAISPRASEFRRVFLANL